MRGEYSKQQQNTKTNDHNREKTHWDKKKYIHTTKYTYIRRNENVCIERRTKTKKKKFTVIHLRPPSIIWRFLMLKALVILYSLFFSLTLPPPLSFVLTLARSLLYLSIFFSFLVSFSFDCPRLCRLLSLSLFRSFCHS